MTLSLCFISSLLGPFQGLKLRLVVIFDLKLFTTSVLKQIIGYLDMKQVLSLCLIIQDIIRMERKHSQQLCKMCEDTDFKQSFQREIGTSVYKVGASKDASRPGRAISAQSFCGLLDMLSRSAD